MDYTLDILMEGGQCPYQITGSFIKKDDNKTYYFYFRSRAQGTRLEVFNTLEDMEELKNCIYYRNFAWSINQPINTHYDAGYIDKEQANLLLSFFILDFFKYEDKIFHKEKGENNPT